MPQVTPRTTTFPRANALAATPSSTAIPAVGRTQTEPSRNTSQSQSADTAKSVADAATDKATAAFIRRTLCTRNAASNTLAGGDGSRKTPKPLEELLPPLTSSNEVDLQLYAIIAVIIKEFVSSWYSKITPDHVFVDEVIQIIAHCTRALEQRLRKVDLEALILDEIPGIFEDHVEAYRIAHRTSENNALAAGEREIYHTLRPHPALTPVPSEADPATVMEQNANESAWRQLLVQGVLAVLLPTEELENGCLRALVAEVFSEMIIGNGVSGKACEPWLLWEAITKMAEVLQPHSPKTEAGKATSRLNRYGLVPSAGGEAVEAGHRTRRQWTVSIGDVSTLFWTVGQFAFLAFTALRAVVTALVASPSLPERVGTGMKAAPAPATEGSSQWPSSAWQSATESEAGAVLEMSVWTCAARVVEVEARMPWLAGLISLLHWGALYGPGRVGCTNGGLDRLLSHHMGATVLNSANLPPLLRALRTTLFPNNTPGPARAVPDAEETLAIRSRCAAALLDVVPAIVKPRFFGRADDAAMQADVEAILDLLGDAYLNKHLVFAIIEAVVLRLMPEMGDMGVQELMEERSASFS
ncbi:hypothetical protein K490DRAFT_70449 [Saccharata proteae CBS 121410]|uniref:PXA domain-containing protein n=1 Tax=Saccharata proteae CBS 121410 TaxID=1314787 RepID=A0A9P4I199_9PEZI|nr:hypothetical protein K490DRAFT_70449 [Saccharata proteae CBS 121410]